MWTFRKFSDARAAKKAYREVFLSESGRRVLADMAEEYHLSTPLCGEGISDRQAFINEGRRQVVLDILNTINLDIDTLPKEYDK